MRPLSLLSIPLTVFVLLSPSHAFAAVTECKGAQEPSVENGCGTIGSEGCCDAWGRVQWCQGGDLYCNDCTNGFEHCGWHLMVGYYDCGAPEATGDPSGTHPYSCGPSCGVCAKGEVCLDDGTCYKPQCQGMECGKDPQGISCGVCDFGFECVEGLFQCLPYPTPCVPGDGPGCEGCACESCVCGKYPNCCTENWDIFCVAACETECGFDCSPCPENPSCGEIECGMFCGVDCGDCPGGQTCQGGKCCVPDCSGGMQCGPDGCGGSCGDCPGTDVCVSGLCVACQPQCQGKECGSDACDGSCGTCPQGAECKEGLCSNDNSCAGNCGGQAPGQCWCDDQCKGFGDCCDDFCEACPAMCDCTPDCGGKECGGDGCGGSCGDCPVTEVCEDGVCVACQPQCQGKECGADGCGDVCGNCSKSQACVNGTCADDPCGGITYEGCCKDSTIHYCESGELKSAECQSGTCGWNPNQSFYDCGQSGEEDPSGEHPIDCPDECEPDCEGKACGDDGCEGSCGSCDEGLFCHAFACQEGECGEFTWEGCCEDNILYYCQEGLILEIDCDTQDGPCGWEVDNGYYNCNTTGEADPTGGFPMDCPVACEPDCEGKECGDDGCDGSCGECELKGWICLSDGTCCERACGNMACGDDGCGGSCVECPEGLSCSAGSCVSGSETEQAEVSDISEDVGGDSGPDPGTDAVPDVGKDLFKPKDTTVGWKDTAAADIPVADPGGPPDSGTKPVGSCSVAGTGTPGPVSSLPVLAAFLALGLLVARRRHLASALAPAGALILLVACSSVGSGGADTDTPTDSKDVPAQDMVPESLVPPDMVIGDLKDVKPPTDVPLDLPPDVPVDVKPDTEDDDGIEPDLPDSQEWDGGDVIGDAADHGSDGTEDTVAEDVVPDEAPEASDITSDPEPGTGDAADDAVEVDTPAPYICGKMPSGPFELVDVDWAIASEDLAFDGKGNLIGSNNTNIYKSNSDGSVQLFAPNVKTRSAMRMLPNGTLAVNDDKLGRVLLFDPDGVMTVLVQGLQYPNGMAVDLQGYIYVTEENANRVIRIHSYSGKYTVLTKAISHPNGITFNATYDRLYIGSFGTPKIYTMTISPDGIPGKVKVFVDFSSINGLMDGMGVDICGYLYVCEYGSSDIWRISPDGTQKVKIVNSSPNFTYLPNMQWGRGPGWDPLSLYVPDGWNIGVWRIEIGVPSAPLPFP